MKHVIFETVTLIDTHINNITCIFHLCSYFGYIINIISWLFWSFHHNIYSGLLITHFKIPMLILIITFSVLDTIYDMVQEIKNAFLLLVVLQFSLMLFTLRTTLRVLNDRLDSLVYKLKLYGINLDLALEYLLLKTSLSC